MTSIVKDDPLSVGFNATLGMEIEHWSEGKAIVSIDIQPHHLNRSNTLHGGVLMSLMDTASGLCGCYCTVEGNVRRAVTLSQSSCFTGQVRDGRVTATAKVTTAGRSIFFSSVEVRDTSGQLLSTAQATYKYRRGSENPEGIAVSYETRHGIESGQDDEH